mmetsp:Transcript_36316/g.64000  ORF Transcript_36316/g.64000 Transcript_36316/m.64000 type:complete len:156 (-) Transcript_36316:965-1432(-)
MRSVPLGSSALAALLLAAPMLPALRRKLGKTGGGTAEACNAENPRGDPAGDVKAELRSLEGNRTEVEDGEEPAPPERAPAVREPIALPGSPCAGSRGAGKNGSRASASAGLRVCDGDRTLPGTGGRCASGPSAAGCRVCAKKESKRSVRREPPAC